MSEQKSTFNRYFSCFVNKKIPEQLVTISPSLAEKIKANPQYESEDPVREYAYRLCAELVYTQVGFPSHFFLKELSQEDGDRTLEMQRLLSTIH